MFGDDKNKVSRLVAHQFVIPLLILTAGAWGQTYTAVDLGAVIAPSSVNNTGRVIAIIQTIDGYEQPVTTVDGNVDALDALHSDDTARPVAINSSGMVAGYSCQGQTSACSAVTWVDGNAPKSFAVGFSPSAINDAGDIVGSLSEINSSGLPNTSGLAIWRKGVFSPLPLLSQPVSTYLGGIANAINSVGVIAGGVDFVDSNSVIIPHAVVWNGSMVQDLGANARANAINDHGQVVGYAANGAASWTNGVLTDLGNVSGGFTIAYGINNSSIIVGTAELPFNPSRAFGHFSGRCVDQWRDVSVDRSAQAEVTEQYSSPAGPSHQ